MRHPKNPWAEPFFETGLVSVKKGRIMGRLTSHGFLKQARGLSSHRVRQPRLNASPVCPGETSSGYFRPRDRFAEWDFHALENARPGTRRSQQRSTQLPARAPASQWIRAFHVFPWPPLAACPPMPPTSIHDQASCLCRPVARRSFCAPGPSARSARRR